MYWCLLLFCVFTVVQGSQNLTPCYSNDKACITQLASRFYNLAIKGDPSKNIQALDPLFQSYVEGKLAIVDYKLYNATVLGFKTCNVVDSMLDLNKEIFNFKLICPRLTLYGIYEISGKILTLPIEGKGDFKVECDDYHGFIDTETKIVEANGKKYLQFKNFKINADLKGGMNLDAKNLFYGKNDELADAALKFINQQWKPVSKELQGPILNINVKMIVKNINKYLKKESLDTLFYDYKY